MTPEDEEFNRIEMESRIKQDYVRDMKQPSREQLMAEVAVLTELVRVLSDRLSKLEKPWVGLTDDEIDLLEELYAPPVHPDFVNDADHCLELIRHVEDRLKEKNNG